MELNLDEPLLSADDERDLARWLEAGVVARHLLARGSAPVALAVAVPDDELELLVARAERARERFVLANLRLVMTEASRTARRWGQSEDELFQEGVAGLMMAVDRFDPGLGLRFATYALPWIRACVFKSVVRHSSGLHLSNANAELRRVARRVAAGLAEELGRQPAVEEVARAMGKPVESVAPLLVAAPHTSMTGAEGEMLDRADPRAQAAYTDVEARMAPDPIPLDRLEARDRNILALRFGLADGAPHSRAEVSRRLGVTATTVRRRELRALAQLRRAVHWRDGVLEERVGTGSRRSPVHRTSAGLPPAPRPSVAARAA